MYRMEYGYMERYGDTVVAWGEVYGNPKFEEGSFIHTSKVAKAQIENEVVHIFTQSGSHYTMEIGEIRSNALECTRDALGTLGVVLDTARCQQIIQAKEEEVCKTASGLLKPGELYIRLSDVNIIRNAYFMDEKGKLIPASVRCHVGTFKDSMLVSVWGACDFRYFPEIDMEPYHWSDGLHAVKIHNIGEDFNFRGSSRRILCKRDTITTVEAKEYTGEGLFSPDMVTGKCIFSRMMEGDNK